MPYDEDLVHRIRELLGDEPALTEKRMFGGLAFLLDGHITVAASSKGGLMARVPPEETDALRERDGVTAMVMRGREMDGWVRVTADAVEDDAALREWVDRGVAVARAL